MADNNMHTLDTRIKLKYDSYVNWMNNDPVLLAGEVAIATVESTESNQSGTGFANLPNVVIKVGNGTDHYSALKFVSGLAADVYGWAKAKDKPVYLAGEIEGLEDYINTAIQDTDTRYTIMTEESAPYVIKLMATDPAKDDLTYDTLVATIDLSTLDTRLKTVEAALGEGGSVAKQISDAIGAIVLAEQTAGVGKVFNTIKQENGIVTVTTRDLGIADVAGLQDALDAKQDDLPIDGEPSEENKVATQATVTNAINTLNNADEVAEKQFVTGVKETNGIVEVSRRALVAADIPVIEQDQVNGLENALAGKQENLVFDGEYNPETNPVATKASVTQAVADLEGAMHFVGAAESDPLTWTAEQNGAYSAGDVVLWGDYEYVYDGNAWLELGNTNLYQLKTDAESEHAALQKAIDDVAAAKQDNLPISGAPSDENPVMTKEAVATEIAGNNEALKYTGGDAAEHKFATKVTQENGVVAAEYAQPVIADISGLQVELDAIDEAIEDMDAAKQDNVAFDGEYNAESNKAATVGTVTSAIEALDKADAAVEGQFVTAVSEENGLVTVSRGAVTTDHIQQGALTLVFDCGTSAI